MDKVAAPVNDRLTHQSLILALLAIALQTLFSGLLFASGSLLFKVSIDQLSAPLPLILILMISMSLSYIVVMRLSRHYFWHNFVPQLVSSAFWLLISIASGVLLAWLVHNATLWFKPPSDMPSTIENILTGHLGIKILAYFLVVILAPVFEEYLFRGLIFDGFQQKYGVVVAIAVSSVVFMAFHLLEYYQYWVASLAILLLATALGAIRYYSRSMLNPIICHASYNLLILTLAQQ